MESSKKTGNLRHLPPPREALSTAIRRVGAPSFREVMEYRRVRAGRERIEAYSVQHPGFAYVLEMLESDDQSEIDEEDRAEAETPPGEPR